MKIEMTTCCFCGKLIPEDWANNPWPLKNGGVCCIDCNDALVIPARIELAKIKRKGEKAE